MAHSEVFEYLTFRGNVPGHLSFITNDVVGGDSGDKGEHSLSVQEALSFMLLTKHGYRSMKFKALAVS